VLRGGCDQEGTFRLKIVLGFEFLLNWAGENMYFVGCGVPWVVAGEF